MEREQRREGEEEWKESIVATNGSKKKGKQKAA